MYCCCFNPPTALGSNHCDGPSNEGVENTGKMSSKWVLEVQNTVNGSVKEVNYGTYNSTQKGIYKFLNEQAKCTHL